MIDQDNLLFCACSPDRRADATRPDEASYRGDPLPHSAEHTFWAEPASPLIPQLPR
ncbi:hypothetical protein [Amycolatopsis silviterrae]|uniref:Uncharacterized protein n=1 Tax=Amycolatopsis silviterrae TaxID=1656914 RepID=A0ABW5HI19_9PSEU